MVDVTVEALLGGVWTDVSGWVDADAGITITRGRSDWAADTDPGAATLTLLDDVPPTARWSPGTPTSPNYGLFGLGTPLRCAITHLGTPRYRFYGEVASASLDWDTSDQVVRTPVEAHGILHRMRTGIEPLESALYRHYVTAANDLVQYWPCEELSGRKLRRFASALGGPSLSISLHAPNASVDDTFPCSKPLPRLDGDQWRGKIPHYTFSSAVQLRWLMIIDAAGSVNGQTIMELQTTGPIYRVRYETGGTLRLQILDQDENQIQNNTGIFAAGMNGRPLLMSLELSQNGNNVDWALRNIELSTGTVRETSGTITGRKVHRAQQVRVSPDGGIDNIVVGHITFERAVTPLSANAAFWFDALNAWAGELAGERIERLCAEEGVAFESVGVLAETAPVGPQPSARLSDIASECARTDQGIVYEPVVGGPGVGYRTHGSLAAQAAVTLDYAAVHLSSLQPVYDDQRVRNDVTVRDASGDFARRRLGSGPLSVREYPDGVGRRDHSADVNTTNDAVLNNLARWVLHLGTQDLLRYPQVTVHLHRKVFTGDAALTTALLGLRLGDRLVVDNLPAHLPGDRIPLIVESINDQIGPFTHEVTFVCSPEEPYHVGVFDATGWVWPGVEPRFDNDSTLGSGVTSTATSLSVATVGDRLWTTDAAEFPFDVQVGGEVMTVTAVAGTSSPQSFTVSRSVNGVVKAHSTGAALSLAYPAYFDL